SSVAKYMVKRCGPPSQGWRTFLRNHAPDIAAMDLFVTPTIGFDVLYAFIIVRLARRDLVWINVTPHPTAEWIARQIKEAFPWNEAPRYLIREIARRIGVAASTVRVTLKRFQTAGLSWPLPEELTDAALEAKLFADAGTKQGHRRQVEPDWTAIHRELKRKHVTLSILWDEYIERHSQGYRYSRFCELYRSWEAKLSVTMRQTHVGGDKLFVDYASDTVPVIVDRLTGEVRQAQIFVAVMGASSFTYVEATWTQALSDWIGAHTRAFAAIGGVPRLIVPDNAKVAVIKACLYEPQVNRTYAEMAAHYGTAVLPARPRRPRHKPRSKLAC